MTSTTASAAQASATTTEESGEAPDPATTPAAIPVRKQAPGLRRAGSIMMLGALFVLGFVVYLYGLSGISESHAQSVMYKTFVYKLNQAIAPTGPTSAGPIPETTPVAVLNIPEIGLNNAVVVEGTTSRDLTLGPGHVPSSVLPGQAGWSFIYGKVATFGAPFAHLADLRKGDRFTVATAQGIATYVVSSFGTSQYPARDNSANRLVLMTADSAGIPTYAIQVGADLVGRPQTDPGGWPLISPQENYLASDTDSLIPLLLWSQALLLIAIAGTYAAYRWNRWATYLLVSPVVLAVVWSIYENLAGLLPNIY